MDLIKPRLKILHNTRIKLQCFCVSETHLRNTDSIKVPGYVCFNNNRKNIKHKAKKGSGGVAVLVSDRFMSNFRVKVISDTIDSMLGVSLESKAGN